MKNLEVRGPSSMAEAENNWKSLWGEEHNIRKEHKNKKGTEKKSQLHVLDAYTDYGNYFILV